MTMWDDISMNDNFQFANTLESSTTRHMKLEMIFLFSEVDDGLVKQESVDGSQIRSESRRTLSTYYSIQNVSYAVNPFSMLYTSF